MTYDPLSGSNRSVSSIDEGFTTRPEVVGRFGVVASTSAIASAVGLQILELGGNAFDAAVAVGLALQVVEPEYNGLGGEVVILTRTAESRGVRVLCGQGTAPRRATTATFASLGYLHMPAAGLLAATVPGAFDAWMLLLKDLGSMSLEAVLRPAIELGADGIFLKKTVCQKIAKVETRFQRHGWEASRDIYLSEGVVPKTYAILQNKALSSTLQSLAERSKGVGLSRVEGIQAARDFFYRGPIAAAVADFSREKAISESAIDSGGLIERSDLESWAAHWEDALSTTYRGWTVYKAGPWSQGLAMIQHLNLLQKVYPEPSRWVDEAHVHAILETAKIAFSDRDAYYGDPKFVNVPINLLASLDYAARRASEVTAMANNEMAPMAHRDGVAADGVSPAPDPGRHRGHEGDTCHFDIIDRFGNVVSATPSGGWFQDSPVVPGLGFSLNTRGQMFNLTAGHPNCLAPGKRPRTTLSPTIAIDQMGRVLSLGAPGADYQDQSSLLVFLSHVHFGCSLQEAVENVAFRSEHFIPSAAPYRAKPGVVTVESRFPPAARELLHKRGHIVEVKGDYSLNTSTAAASDGKLLRAAAGPSKQRGYAVGR